MSRFFRNNGGLLVVAAVLLAAVLLEGLPPEADCLWRKIGYGHTYIFVRSMGVKSSLRLCCRTVSRARAVSTAVTQPTPCSTAERRILKPSESCLRPRVGVLIIRSTVQ